MSALELKFAAWEMHDHSTKDVIDDSDTGKKYCYSRTTDFRGTTVFKILREFVQPATEQTLWGTIHDIRAILPDAPLSTEACITGDIILEIADQIPWHHPSQLRLAQIAHLLTTSSKLSESSETVCELNQSLSFNALTRCIGHTW